MKTVWKFELERGDTDIDMPIGSQILRAAEQQTQPGMVTKLFFWALVDDERKLETRTFELLYTGVPVPPYARYIATIERWTGLVEHVFETTHIHKSYDSYSTLFAATLGADSD